MPLLLVSRQLQPPGTWTRQPTGGILVCTISTCTCLTWPGKLLWPDRNAEGQQQQQMEPHPAADQAVRVSADFACGYVAMITAIRSPRCCRKGPCLSCTETDGGGVVVVDGGLR